MNRLKCLDPYQKIVLILMAAMVVVFTIAYPLVLSREGFEYKDRIFIPHEENGIVIYSGKIGAEETSFTVYADKTVEFRHGNKIYEPYTAKEDPTAIPKDNDMGAHMTGVELRQGEKILFRGGIVKDTEIQLLYNEDGSIASLGITITAGNAIARDLDGNIIDPIEPSPATILDLMDGPELTHKGEWFGWFSGVFICIITAVSILFADELFRWNLAFSISNADQAKPSDWEMTSRYISWTILPFVALVVFIMGIT